MGWNKTKRNEEGIEIYGDSLVRLHKVLKEDDLLKAIHRAERTGGESNVTPVIIIDFATVTSIQEDYKRKGAIIMDNNKTAVIVTEHLDEVLDAWCEVKERLSYKEGVDNE